MNDLGRIFRKKDRAYLFFFTFHNYVLRKDTDSERSTECIARERMVGTVSFQQIVKKNLSSKRIRAKKSKL